MAQALPYVAVATGLYGALKPSKEQTSYNEMPESPQQVWAASQLQNMAGVPYSAAQSPLSKQAATAASAELATNYDPFTSAYYKGYRGEVKRTTDAGVNRINQEAARGGNLMSGARVQGVGNYQANMDDEILKEMGLLQNQERTRKTNAISMADQIGSENLKYNQQVAGYLGELLGNRPTYTPANVYSQNPLVGLGEAAMKMGTPGTTRNAGVDNGGGPAGGDQNDLINFWSNYQNTPDYGNTTMQT